ncbi:MULTISPECIES: ABC transporter permease [unclassified Paenibacillus]|uniref:ABC transporter permease n=1 Tax=unclassified Paenibacillus TaxID=185978 RepID=UPI001AE38846|nr:MULTISPECIES: ABC transporter permease [unclassified Paenibacillus]MBP1155896.1 peptide/nickel transport system permease protein [Paenibacillus sp. PvP091]MBP1168718.1 peptide/nickel transport system permease protein [Paenibacillus sp. PvR098]MBP2439746.1 peptide/nickel transport system permease protein [Paenibacillus sp. PvP052]
MSSLFVPERNNKRFTSKFNHRQRALLMAAASAALIVGTWLTGLLLDDVSLSTNLEMRNLIPSLSHPFGTDWLGRDMFTRTLKGLNLSIQVGMMAAAVSVSIAVILGMLAATMGKTVDRIIGWLIDLFLSVPHLVTLILISFVLGGGVRGVVIGIALTHWPSLARVIRAEVLQLRSSEFIQISRRMGKSRWWVAVRHMMPHLIPQMMVGLLLVFPHAILHEAAISFLGMGLSPHQPAIGIILSESMRYLSTGLWWLAFFPGLCLLLVVRSFDTAGENIRLLLDSHRSNE